MLRGTSRALNTYLTQSVATAPISVIRTGPRYWSDPERLVKHKILYFTMGIDQLPLRRTAVIQNDLKRFHMCKPAPRVGDATGYKKARSAQLTTWYRRIQYQEYYMQHLFTRHMWSLLRMYPGQMVKIQGKADDGYAGYDSVPYHRYNRAPLPFPAKEMYDRRQ